jgi:hypothetical protein
VKPAAKPIVPIPNPPDVDGGEGRVRVPPSSTGPELG